MNPELRRRFFDEIIAYMSRSGRPKDFRQTQAIFDGAFRYAAEVHGQPYGEQHQADGLSLYFVPFSDINPSWCCSIEILDLHDHYAVFDRTGRYALYERNGTEFGRLVFANPSENSIALLEGCMAGDMISSIVGFRQRDLSSSNIINNRLRIDALPKKSSLASMSKLIRFFRSKKIE